MAHADLASAPARSGALNGIPRFFARTARLTRADAARFLFRLVPALVFIFIASVIAAAVIQARAAREEALAAASEAVEILARVLAAEIAPPRVVGGFAGAVSIEIPALDRGATQGARIFVADADGRILSAHPPRGLGGVFLVDALGDAQALATFGERAGVMRVTLPSGDDAIAAARHLKSGEIGRAHV